MPLERSGFTALSSHRIDRSCLVSVNILLASQSLLFVVGPAPVNLRSTASFTILAELSITMNTGSKLDGRALAAKGAATFDGTAPDSAVIFVPSRYSIVSICEVE